VKRVLVLAGALLSLAIAAPAGAAAAPLHVHWMRGFAAPGTPARFNRVGVIQVGARSARNVLVLEPGTSAGAAYFVPLAQWIVHRMPGWQVWAVERRENLLEDQSVLQAAKRGQATATQLFDYYLGWIIPGAYSGPHVQPIANSRVRFAKRWGMQVAVEDLHAVIAAARRRGGRVVLGGHSLGGAVVTAYATWNFAGRPGAADLAGLVYIDGGSLPAVGASTARTELRALDSSESSPWLTFGGIPAPFAGLFSATGSLGALTATNQRSLGQSFPLLPSYLKPPVPVTNLAQYGYALNVGTSPRTLIAAQAHLGKGVSRSPTRAACTAGTAPAR
jgi:pimeloyl-ACP methyl ester carboxylesterase